MNPRVLKDERIKMAAGYMCVCIYIYAGIVAVFQTLVGIF